MQLVPDADRVVRAKTIVGGASKNKKIRDRVDSEGEYGRWRVSIVDPPYLHSVYTYQWSGLCNKRVCFCSSETFFFFLLLVFSRLF